VVVVLNATATRRRAADATVRWSRSRSESSEIEEGHDGKGSSTEMCSIASTIRSSGAV
jgi:hypothetical protein